MSKSEPTPLALALGRIPTGLYIVTTIHEGKPIGFVGSFVMQMGFEPPSVVVAIGTDRDHLKAIRESKSFAISILDAASQGVMSTFFKGGDPFEQLDYAKAPSGCAIFENALAWFDCQFTGEHASGDHVAVFGTVQTGKATREGEPSVHLRKNGLGY